MEREGLDWTVNYLDRSGWRNRRLSYVSAQKTVIQQ